MAALTLLRQALEKSLRTSDELRTLEGGPARLNYVQYEKYNGFKNLAFQFFLSICSVKIIIFCIVKFFKNKVITNFRTSLFSLLVIRNSLLYYAG